MIVSDAFRKSPKNYMKTDKTKSAGISLSFSFVSSVHFIYYLKWKGPAIQAVFS